MEKWSKYSKKAEQQGIKENGYKMVDLLPIRQKHDNPVYAGLVESMNVAVGIVLNVLKENGRELLCWCLLKIMEVMLMETYFLHQIYR